MTGERARLSVLTLLNPVDAYFGTTAAALPRPLLWFALGWPAFLGVYWLMFAKPTSW